MIRKTALGVTILTAIIVIGYFALPQKVIAPSKLETKIIKINSASIEVEIADKPHEQSLGLSGRDKLDQNKGMLFVFPELQKPGFWMKEMKFPLDIIWMDADGKIIDITKNLSPETYPRTFSPPSPIKYVLEVNSGWSDKNKIKIGNLLNLNEN